MPVLICTVVVDDDEAARDQLGAILTKRADRVVSLENAESAWSFIQKHTVDLIISDIEMEGMDGIGLLRRVKGKSPKQRYIATPEITTREQNQ